MEIIDFVKDNWASLAAAPWAFVTLVCFALAVGFLVARFLGAEKTALLDGRIAALKETIDDYKQKLSGASPDEAKQKISNLEARLAALEPRELTEGQRNTLVQHLNAHHGVVSLMLDMAAQKSQKFAREIEKALTRSGWQVRFGQALGVSNRPSSGIRVTSFSGGEDITSEARAIMGAFSAAQIKFEFSKAPAKHRPEMPAGFPQMPEEPATEILITDVLD
ncbi:hypothetical protein N8E89_09215 [Phyllobacterium sp. A18/5-2]|uniref:hypothetical protein n=1 Tax=Phyllobacterium sp. A18/5-2 TaxID=2978392 RepID=UPI0021CACD45|nr:hypothetical protein [Phyllobacterium sp. A18/5-2]UXN62895.1 hypothetical protein N8E89_09215 [Phyllobacterium sp. A18/5-2]